MSTANNLDNLNQNLKTFSQNHTKKYWINTSYSILNKIVYSLAGVAIIYILYRIRVFNVLWYILKWVWEKCRPVIFINRVNPIHQRQSTVYIHGSSSTASQPTIHCNARTELTN